MRIKMKELREERGMTKRQLAEELGVTPRQIGYWEEGNISFENAIIVSDYFGCSLEEFAYRKPPSGSAWNSGDAKRDMLNACYTMMTGTARDKLVDYADTLLAKPENHAMYVKKDSQVTGSVA